MTTGDPSGTRLTSGFTFWFAARTQPCESAMPERPVGAVDRDPVAAEPAGGQVRLGRGGGQRAAAVGGVEVAAKGVRDREAARSGSVVPGAPTVTVNERTTRSPRRSCAARLERSTSIE